MFRPPRQVEKLTNDFFDRNSMTRKNLAPEFKEVLEQLQRTTVSNYKQTWELICSHFVIPNGLIRKKIDLVDLLER